MIVDLTKYQAEWKFLVIKDKECQTGTSRGIDNHTPALEYIPTNPGMSNVPTEVSRLTRSHCQIGGNLASPPSALPLCTGFRRDPRSALLGLPYFKNCIYSKCSNYSFDSYYLLLTYEYMRIGAGHSPSVPKCPLSLGVGAPNLTRGTTIRESDRHSHATLPLVLIEMKTQAVSMACFEKGARAHLQVLPSSLGAR